jgi:hypothetical protein
MKTLLISLLVLQSLSFGLDKQFVDAGMSEKLVKYYKDLELFSKRLYRYKIEHTIPSEIIIKFHKLGGTPFLFKDYLRTGNWKYSFIVELLEAGITPDMVEKYGASILEAKNIGLTPELIDKYLDVEPTLKYTSYALHGPIEFIEINSIFYLYENGITPSLFKDYLKIAKDNGIATTITKNGKPKNGVLGFYFGKIDILLVDERYKYMHEAKKSNINIDKLFMGVFKENYSKKGTSLLKNRNIKSFKETLKELKDNGCKELSGNFAEADEYDNEGKCYWFDAKLIQRVDKTEGMALYKTDKPFGVKFGKSGIESLPFAEKFFDIPKKNFSWRKNTQKQGYIKGVGASTYQNALGFTHQMPKGVLIKFGF